MPAVTLRKTWVITEAAKLLGTSKPDDYIRSGEPLIHQDFPGVSFHLYVYPAGCVTAKRGFASFYINCVFDPVNQRQVVSTWARWTCGLYNAGDTAGAADIPFGPQYRVSVHVYTARLGNRATGVPEAWRHDTFRSCIRSDGTLHVRLELSLFRMADLISERSLPLPLKNLEDNLSDFKILVNGKEYRVHRSILVESSHEMARMFATQMKETTDNVLDLKSTAACETVEALLKALYQKSWDFLGSMDLTIDVLELAEKYGFHHIQSYCEAALMEVKNSENVLDILVAADRFRASMLKNDCIEFISVNEIIDIEVLESASWKKFKSNNATKDLALEITAAIIKGFDEKQKRRPNNQQGLFYKINDISSYKK